MRNIITLTDSYKLNHWNQYPKGTEKVYSYFESRKGALFGETVFFGLQYILKSLEGSVVTRYGIEQAEELCRAHFGREGMFNREMWEVILNEHGGKLPVRIRAVPEGSVIPVNNVMMTIVNTDPRCAPLTNHLETILTHVWASSTVATLSRECKKIIKRFLDETADSSTSLPFMLHDFGFRGVSSVESAGILGCAHLVNFKGTDTVHALEVAQDFYFSPYKDTAYSVPATEHSIMTALGRDGEKEVVSQLLDNYPSGILSVVADSYDICNFVQTLGTEFKERILARDGVFVVRPDSVTDELQTPAEEVVWIAQNLYAYFGGTLNSRGYLTLNPKVRILWGDGLDIMGIHSILKDLKKAGFSADNMATFGMGGGLLQRINRDQQRFAFKSSAQFRDGAWHDVYKEPKDLSKVSKKGQLKLVKTSNGYETVSVYNSGEDQLVTVFEDGIVLEEWTLSEIRERAELYG